MFLVRYFKLMLLGKNLSTHCGVKSGAYAFSWWYPYCPVTSLSSQYSIACSASSHTPRYHKQCMCTTRKLSGVAASLWLPLEGSEVIVHAQEAGYAPLICRTAAHIRGFIGPIIIADKLLLSAGIYHVIRTLLKTCR